MSKYSISITAFIEKSRDGGIDTAQIEYETIIEAADAQAASNLTIDLMAKFFYQDEDAMDITHIDIVPAEERS